MARGTLRLDISQLADSTLDQNQAQYPSEGLQHLPGILRSGSVCALTGTGQLCLHSCAFSSSIWSP